MQLIVSLGTLFLLAFVPLFFAISSLTQTTLRVEREAHARAVGRVVAAYIAEAQRYRSPAAIGPLLDAQLTPSSGLVGLALYDSSGDLISHSGGGEVQALLPQRVRPGEEASLRAFSRHGPALLVLVPGAQGSVLTALRLDDQIGQGGVLLRLVGLYMLVIAFALLLFVYFALTRLVVRPIDDLSAAAERVLSGIRRLEPPTHGAAELITLGHSFSHMTGRLLENEEALQSKINALERATLELKEAQSNLIRSERLASVGRLSAGLAHEVGNPLAALMGLQDLLLEGGLSTEEERDFLVRMRKETERIHRILRKLLDFSRPGHATKDHEPGRLSDAVEEVLELMRPQKKMREVQLSVDINRDLPPVKLNHEALVQVILNLLDNAADATGGEGSISLRAYQEENSLRFEVQDNGPGVHSAILSTLFEPFVSSKPVGEGTGLGLAVCRGLLEEIGGQIFVENASPGARFIVILPMEPSAEGTSKGLL